jgi:zinc resistance-associated protein
MKALATLTAASVLILVGAAAIAQQSAPPSAAPNAPAVTAPAPGPGPGGAAGRANLDAIADARLAGIQAGLKLNDEQRRLWGPVEQVLRAEMEERAERRAERAERREERQERREERRSAGAAVAPRDRVDYMERIERRTERAAERAERLRSLSAAMRPFWASLDDQQRRLLPRLIREARNDRGHREGRGNRRPWRH